MALISSFNSASLSRWSFLISPVSLICSTAFLLSKTILFAICYNLGLDPVKRFLKEILLQFAFPYVDDIPSLNFEIVPIVNVSGSISINLFFPVQSVVWRRRTSRQQCRVHPIAVYNLPCSLRSMQSPARLLPVSSWRSLFYAKVTVGVWVL